MEVKDLIKKYGEGKGEATMWKSVDIISEMLEEKLTPEEKACLEKKLYALMQGEHYDEHFAKAQVSQMYYTDPQGEKHYAPYWTDDEVKQVWIHAKPRIKTDANMWDFYVALNMTKSDNCNLFKSWWPDATNEELSKRIIDATVNWLNDEDAPQGEARVWRYFNS